MSPFIGAPGRQQQPLSLPEWPSDQGATAGEPGQGSHSSPSGEFLPHDARVELIVHTGTPSLCGVQNVAVGRTRQAARQPARKETRMSWKERTASPAWRCFRADFQRHWRVRTTVRAMSLFVGLVGLQLALGFALTRFPWAAASGGRQWIWMLAGALGLNWSSVSLYPSLPQPQRDYLLFECALALVWLACHFLMPAYAASSIAPDRERRRIPELILAGLSPRQIVLAKGLAAVLPFLAVGIGASTAWIRPCLGPLRKIRFCRCTALSSCRQFSSCAGPFFRLQAY